jgi:hypothetical protein
MRAICAIVGLVVLLASDALAQDAGRANPSVLHATLSGLPVYFVENRGIYPDEVAYYVQGADKTLFFTQDGVTFRLKGKDRGWVVKLEFIGANPDVVPRGTDRQRAVFSYFKGPEKDWKTGLPTFSKVAYRDLWPGIDLVFTGTVNKLKYEFVVRPGADPGKIRLRYEGATEVAITEAGAIRVATPVGSFEDEPPVAWQEIDATREPVEVGYALDENGRFGLDVAAHDRTRPLVLDPVILVYCGYIGGGKLDWGYGIALDAAGNAYVAGTTTSDEKTFPVTVGPDLTFNGVTKYPDDVFVAKVNARGTALLYCGYIGGSDYDQGRGIAVDAAGNAYVTGETNSSDFPVKVGPDLTYNGWPDAFVAKVNAQGTALAYCGYIGGSNADDGNAVAVDSAGNAYVTGWTMSDEKTFPVRVGPDLTQNGGAPTPTDAFVAKVHPQGTALIYCGYIGGTGHETGSGIVVDAAGCAFVTGYTQSDETTFPVAIGPDLTHNRIDDAFVAKIDAKGAALLYCGYIGGNGYDRGQAIALDAAGNAYITGSTDSDEKTFPVKIGPDTTFNGGLGIPGDGFVAKVDARGATLLYCGYIGGSGYDWGLGIAVDAAGNAFVAGSTNSDQRTFPVKTGPDLTFNGWTDAFVAMVDTTGAALRYCGYIGGTRDEEAKGIALDRCGNAYVTGYAESTETSFPAVVGPDLTHNDTYAILGDGFVAKVALTLLRGSGVPRPGGTLKFTLTATDDAARPYQLGTSLGTGPIPIDRRKLDLSPDDLLLVSTSDLWPWIFSGYRGVVDSRGQARAAIHIPSLTALIGVRLHSAFVTLDRAAPSGIASISNTFSFSVTK